LAVGRGWALGRGVRTGEWRQRDCGSAAQWRGRLAAGRAVGVWPVLVQTADADTQWSCAGGHADADAGTRTD